MDTLDFLGGKYQGGEQIVPGVIQTYRALETATGRSVYVHRVASSDDPREQAVLYRLLSAALVRSPAVRSMVLDMREDTRDWLVITETDPRCLLLREWLQFELENSAKVPEPDKRIAAPSPSPVDSPVAGSLPPPAKIVKEPGEFTQFFQRSSADSLPPKSSGSERTSRTGIVQRPNTPMPPLPPSAPPVNSAPPANSAPLANKDPGEFTKMFSKAAPEHAAPPHLPGAHQSPDDFDNLFAAQNEFPMPAAGAAPVAGEFTQVFGRGESPQVRPPSAFGQRARTNFDDPLSPSPATTRAVPPAPRPTDISAPSTAGSDPSEFTRVIGGNRAAMASPTPAAGAALPSAAGAPAPALPTAPPVMPLPGLAAPPLPHAPAPPVMPHAPAIPPLPSLTTPPMPQAAAAPPPAAGTVPAPASNKKLIVFLSVLGFLALVLVLLVLFALRK